MNSLTEENYLKALYHLVNENDEVSVNDLSRQLNIKMPSVNSMVKKFAEKNWVKYESYKPIKLTESGKKEASLIVRKHRLTEMFLVEKMGFGWENVHEIAEQLEHIHSDAFFDKMDEILNYPKMDPHGEPIPDKDGNVLQPDHKKLSKCKENETVELASVTTSSEDFLNFLNKRDLSLGTKLKILQIEGFDQSMLVAYNGREENFSKTVCERLLVK
ncbi:metal-dependent transcriptional regulator [Epilithonimonas ginsengisoli]|uniref:Transcriptional regulator MntR n=1 Tax=Epilithonimonas ginsengisoli TaxID=1245592 RepID=A0ABU4JFP9_9FLAO|nr:MULTISPECIES: metal-dependent transcriptional regulator [Chryseobacterium group]MBV6879702.1 metal-dependent transcriptional regulator [Epilithonimonas sp. FP105]MDW8548341.1 metal-dependent transcriptional regulator [Epilithonimonas ginsengisoli]OAH72574.1 iron (metal) dependent repressor, dtxr family protein [Chryseobacterium sp. FP211-J200]